MKLGIFMLVLGLIIAVGYQHGYMQILICPCGLVDGLTYTKHGWLMRLVLALQLLVVVWLLVESSE